MPFTEKFEMKVRSVDGTEQPLASEIWEGVKGLVANSLEAKLLLRVIVSDAAAEFNNLYTLVGLIRANEIKPRHVVVLMIMNVFNKTDAYLEKSAGVSLTEGINDRRVFDGNFSFNEAMEIIETVGKDFGVPLVGFKEEVTAIVQAQSEGMELVRQTRENKKISYSLKQAIDYREKTVGNYYHLLADIGLTKAEKRQRFYDNRMAVQIEDDKRDIVEDHFVQVNPFLAIIAALGLEDQLFSAKFEDGGYRDFIQKANLSEVDQKKARVLEERASRGYFKLIE